MSELREKFEDWFKRFNNCDDKLSADFGYQAGYAQAPKELSEVEPVAYKFEEAVPVYRTEKNACTTASNKRLLSFTAPDFTDQNIHHVVPLISRPKGIDHE
jgi:hypothetical protein